ncbi:hypothetical protein MPNT_100024 [Candidatus Methylacidithermus pantelleriae]|uniref:Uncharacterized protein n=1 Tax=Candidatus Methylacidithermus pantelleriae TaxID=2744239 RepID=A0A8J2FMX3_9BACT|nr:hypothetical protein MPNT_100024 [Candidatus Methylacidithermus pantelleriae]
MAGCWPGSSRGPIFRVTRRVARSVGIDVDEDHLGLVETDRLGNLVDVRRIGWNLNGKSQEQAKAIFLVMRAKRSLRPAPE